ncbi:sialin-like [Mya arenaria]|uniref:sialin-like n=1 Tax=Mya arenaria TaxID=6604 RepID=UPI0022E370C7|nr:sialin-like [Mya arenaria]
MSVAIVCMAKLPDGNSSGYQILTNISIANNDLASCESTNDEQFSAETAEFEWSKKTQSLILSGFFYGFMVTQVPGGWMASRFGGKIVIGLSMALASLCTLLIPVLARASPYAVVFDRIVIGISNKMAIPWRDICTYTPAIAVVVMHTCDTCTFYLILTCLPQYLKEVLKFDIQSNGLYSALPWISMLVGVILAGIGADSFRTKGWFSVTMVRKLFQVSASIGVFLCVVGLTNEAW